MMLFYCCQKKFFDGDFLSLAWFDFINSKFEFEFVNWFVMDEVETWRSERETVHERSALKIDKWF